MYSILGHQWLSSFVWSKGRARDGEGVIRGIPFVWFLLYSLVSWGNERASFLDLGLWTFVATKL